MSSRDGKAARAGSVYLVGAGTGDPDLITRRGAELLASADVVLHDELIDDGLIDRSTGRGPRHDADVRAVGKRGSLEDSKQAKQNEIVQAMLAAAYDGKSVVRLKGGDPMLFGRGAEEAQALRAAGIPFEIVPGVCSPLTAAAYAGIPLTHRDLASSVTYLTAVRRDGSDFDFGQLKALRGTLCVLMGTRRLKTIAERLVKDGTRSATTPAAVIERIGEPRQRTIQGTLENIAKRATDAKLQPPTLLVVGAVVDQRSAISWYDRQPLFGKRVLVTRPAHQFLATAARLRQCGAWPLSFPTIAMVPPPDPEAVTQAVRDLASYDLVAFTSQNAVDFWWAELLRQGLDARAFASAMVAAIGPATADALAAHGIMADVVADTYVAEQLATQILHALGDRPGARVLLPRALVAREVLPERLRDAGLTIDVVPVYQTQLPTQGTGSTLSELVASTDILLLMSSSTAENLCALLGDDAPQKLAGMFVASIGPITTGTAQKLGLNVDVTATESTSDGLIAALESALAARQLSE